MASRIDVVVTWPKDRLLASYLRALAEAKRRRQEINYRVSRRPSWEFGALAPRPARLYRVHDGAVRGYTEILYCIHRYDGEVAVAGSEDFWPAGEYIVCSPEWHPLVPPVRMRGFQGWRWYATCE